MASSEDLPILQLGAFKSVFGSLADLIIAPRVRVLLEGAVEVWWEGLRLIVDIYIHIHIYIYLPSDIEREYYKQNI